MTAQELATMLRESGLDETHVTALVNNAAFQARAAQVARSSDVEAERTRAAQVQAQYERSKAYEDWFNRNHAAIQEQTNAIARYQERFGALDQTTQPGNTQAQPPNGGGKTFTEDDVKRIIAQEMGATYGTQVTNTIMDTGKIVERHMFAGRKNPIDWAKIREAAIANGGNVEAAYDAWDAPERDKAAKADEDKRVEERTRVEVEKRMLAMGNGQFPAGADFGMGNGVSPLAPRDGGDAPKYNRNDVIEAANSIMRDPNYRPGFRGVQ